MGTTNNFSSANFDLPRIISGGIKLRVLCLNTVFGIGFIFLTVGITIASVFSTMVDFKSTYAFSGELKTVDGIVLAKSSTNCSENKRTVYDYTFNYKTDDGKEYTGHSFSSSFSDLSENDSVQVEYVAATPETARIKGMLLAPFGSWVFIFILIFPVIGASFVFFSLRKGRKNIKLLETGCVTFGKVTRREPTNTKINNQTVYKVFFEFTANDGAVHTSYVRSHKLALLGDEAQERLVYNPDKPEEAVLVDSLPKAVRNYFEQIGE